MKWIKIFLLLLVVSGLFGYIKPSMANEKEKNNKMEVNNETEDKGILWTRGKTPLSDLCPEQKKALLGGPLEPTRAGPETISPLEEQLPLEKGKEKEK